MVNDLFEKETEYVRKNISDILPYCINSKGTQLLG